MLTWGKHDLSDFDHDIVVCGRWAGQSISETADLLGISQDSVDWFDPA